MKKMYLLFFGLLGLVVFSCSSQKDNKEDKKSAQEKYEEEGGKDKPDQPDYPNDDNINPERRQITFPAKGDTVIVKTENPFWFISGNEPFYEGQNKNEQITYQPINFDRDTLIGIWVKVIALDNKKDLSSDGKHMFIESKTLKIIAFENNISEERKFVIGLQYADLGDYISINQEGK